MSNREAAKILLDHNEWRRSKEDFPKMQNPYEVGLAIDKAIQTLRKKAFHEKYY